MEIQEMEHLEWMRDRDRPRDGIQRYEMLRFEIFKSGLRVSNEYQINI